MNGMFVIVRIVLFFFIIVPFVIDFLLRRFSKLNETDRAGVCIAVSLVFAVICFYTDLANQVPKIYTTRNLISMQDSTSYIISRYNVDSELKYYYVVESDGVYQSFGAASNRSTIRYVDKDPKVVIYKDESKYKFFKWFLPAEYVDAYSYDFYIPRGSVKEDFKIDTQ